MHINLRYIKKKSGIFKAANVVLGLLAVSLMGAAHDKQDLVNVPVAIACYGTIRPCAQMWASHAGLSIVILAWLFSIGILFLSLLSELNQKAIFRTLDTLSHLLVGIFLLAAGAMIITYIVTFSRLVCHVQETNSYRLPSGFETCTSRHIFLTYKFVYWVIGLIFGAGFTLTVFLTSFTVSLEKDGSSATGIPMEGMHYY